ncbi:hypothetical protein GCM10009838_22800 [Catenulispora subtropica]|uniref:Uncharacterized protein n=1 Tax=Catenulispora subtropica TaxID=450798 RepID=A0ABP5CJ90_9ACTN
MLVDGAEPQIAQIQAEALVLGVQVQIVRDLIHVLEHLWKRMRHGPSDLSGVGLGAMAVARPHEVIRRAAHAAVD